MTDFAATNVNHTALSPASFLKRAQSIFPNRPAVVYGKHCYSWKELYQRCLRCVSAFKKINIQRGDVVSVMLHNTPEMVEMHFALPMSGAIINTINTRLDASTVAYILDHSGAKCLIVDQQFQPVIMAALALMQEAAPQIIEVIDQQSDFNNPNPNIDSIAYEDFLATGTTEDTWQLPPSEWDTIALNYTSGTSGKPKGVLYHHRGAYLMAMGTVPAWGVPQHPRYLYSVPMFHCNGWGHCWMMALVAGTIYCLRQVSAKAIFDAVSEHKISHFGGAPIVLGMLINAPKSEQRNFTHPVKVMTAGAPPPPAVLEKTGQLGFEVMQVYGLTETYGHVMQCLWQDQWDALPFSDQAAIKSRQGVRFPICEDIQVLCLETGQPVPADGETTGEIIIRGNTIMKGYHRDPEATAEAFRGDVFHSGDVAVVHEDGYIEVKDRLKDVIISGGENISSVEIESILYQHPAVAHAAIVAQPDEKWGEVPCAFIECIPDTEVTSEEIIAFCRARLAGFKTPKKVVFETLPKTATGKIQKFALRVRAKDFSL